MGSVAAVRVLHRRTLAQLPADDRPAAEAELAARHEQEAGGLPRACELGVVDEVIEPAMTRQVLARALADTAPTRGRHRNIPL
jgi:acetyl-CoA/propionyl-CoA carboxylase carboxyl transferase subunit